MADSTPSKEQLDKLAKEIEKDQAKDSPAEKRVKVNMGFKKAVKRMGQTPSPKKETK